MKKISKINIESNDPSLIVDINKTGDVNNFSLGKTNKLISVAIFLSLVICLEAIWLLWRCH